MKLYVILKADRIISITSDEETAEVIQRTYSNKEGKASIIIIDDAEKIIFDYIEKMVDKN